LVHLPHTAVVLAQYLQMQHYKMVLMALAVAVEPLVPILEEHQVVLCIQLAVVAQIVVETEQI
jgi:hypothetical protein